MTRIQSLIVATAVAFALPFGAALAQTPSTSVATPSGPVFHPSRNLPSSDVRSPMQEQAMSPGSNLAPMNNECGSPTVATMKDEFGRKYNCRGDRVR